MREYLIAAALAIIGTAVASPQDDKRKPEDIEKEKLEACANNLKQLYKAQMAYAAKFGGKDKRMVADLGSDFWLRLATTTPPIVDATTMNLYSCPAAREKAPAGQTHYRGPAKDANALEDEDVLGCCEPGHHADGAIPVIRKSGDVLILAPGKAGYKDVLERTLGADVKKVKDCRKWIELLTQATKAYELDNNAYPASGNASLVKALQALGPKKLPYFEFSPDSLNDKGDVLDPWGHPFVYRNNAADHPKNLKDDSAHNKTSFDIYSFGPDGKDDKGGGDDVTNWE